MRFHDVKEGLVKLGKAAASVATAEAVIFAATVGPAVAQRMPNGGGSDAPFAPGIAIGLNWVQFLGAAIAVVAFLGGCVLLFMRQVMAAGGAFLFVGVGAALLANSNAIITRLSGLNFG
jgi:hypothetical protein